MYYIMIFIQEDGHPLRHLAQTCTTFYKLFHNLRLGGLYALPTRLPIAAVTPRGLDVISNGSRGFREGRGGGGGRSRGMRGAEKMEVATIRKSGYPGDAYIMFERDVTEMSTAWSVRLDEFRGNRVEIGVATRDAFRFNTVERRSSWSFDCFGRTCCAGRRSTYGRPMRAGEMLTVVYDVSCAVLVFVDGGLSMGALPVRAPPRQPLYPFIYFPFLHGETVTVLRPARVMIDLAQLHSSAGTWARRMQASPPSAGRLIVVTWDDHTWYSIQADAHTMTLAQLWKEIEFRHRMPMHLFELIFKGRRLPNSPDLKLCDVGIRIDKNTGSCSSDILLSVPHIIS